MLLKVLLINIHTGAKPEDPLGSALFSWMHLLF